MTPNLPPTQPFFSGPSFLRGYSFPLTSKYYRPGRLKSTQGTGWHSALVLGTPVGVGGRVSTWGSVNHLGLFSAFCSVAPRTPIGQGGLNFQFHFYLTKKIVIEIHTPKLRNTPSVEHDKLVQNCTLAQPGGSVGWSVVLCIKGLQV